MKKIFLFITFVNLCISGFAQEDDLLAALEKENQEPERTPVKATFKGSRLISAHTNETVAKRNLDFRVAHRFGNMGAASGGGVHTLYGFDSSTDILIAFEYGVSDRLTAGFSRTKRREALQGSLKYKLLMQTTDNKVPLSVTLFANTVYTPEIDADKSYVKGLYRLSYFYQAIIARKFSRGFSFELLPSLLHRNYVKADDTNDIFSLGGAGRIKLTKRSAIIFEYFQVFSKLRMTKDDAAAVQYYAPLGLGWEVETGGHVFSIMFTNASGIIENDFLINTTDSWLKGGFKFSFNISRTFKL